jgi:hypothetical protein
VGMGRGGGQLHTADSCGQRNRSGPIFSIGLRKANLASRGGRKKFGELL